MIPRRPVFLLALSALSVALAAHAQVDPKLYSDMKWREIGPMRARPHTSARRCSQRARHLLPRRRQRGRMEDNRRRCNMAQRLGQ